MIFIKENSKTCMNENKCKRISDATKILGEKWKLLSKKAKLPYENKAKHDKTRYEK